MRRFCALLLGLALPLVPRCLMSQRQWAVDPTPVLDIPGLGAGGDIVLERPVAGTRLADGTIVIADQLASAVRFFDGRGRLVRSVGQKGQGPGDFQLIMWLGQCARDSIFVWDYGLTRITVLSSGGSVVRQYSIPADGARASAPATISCSRDGRFIYQPPGTPRGHVTIVTPDSSVIRGNAVVSLGDARGNVVRSLGEVASGEMILTGRGGGPRGGGFRPLGRATSLALSGDRVYVGTADSGTVDVYAPDGQPAGSVSLGIAPRRATRANYERAVNDMTSMFPAQMRQSISAQMLAAPMPEFLPPYTALLVDGDNLLWAVLSAPGYPDTRLRAVSASGRVVADVRIPVGLTTYEVGHDYILGAYEASDGEPHVAVYRLRRPN